MIVGFLICLGLALTTAALWVIAAAITAATADFDADLNALRHDGLGNLTYTDAAGHHDWTSEQRIGGGS